MRAAKVDGTQREVVGALRGEGCFVVLLHMVGNGIPDLLIAHPTTRRWYLAECKDRKYFKYDATKNKSTHEKQKAFRDKAPAPVLLLTCATDAVTWAKNVYAGTAVELFDWLDGQGGILGKMERRKR